MSAATAIEWTDRTWNPIVGCSIVSPGCTNCYAMKFAARRLENNPATPHYAGTTRKVNGTAVWTGKIALAPDHILLAPLKWKKPRRIFVNSMGDLFHEDIPDEWIDKVFAIMALCPQHEFQLLTKRVKRMRAYVITVTLERISTASVNMPAPARSPDWPLPSVWLGVSCEDQARADERIPDLLATPAAVRFISYEPALGPLQIAEYMPNKLWNDLPSWKQPELDWVICGGESGSGHRPMQMQWAEDIAAQCKGAGVACFFKQDSGPRSGQRGRASDALWSLKEFPA